MHPMNRSRRAIALISALLIITFLTILTGALIKTQSGAFALMRVSDRRRDARLACRSLYDYCLYQLEHDRNWGKNGFATIEEVDPPRTPADLGDRVEIESVKDGVVEGLLTDENLSFQVRVGNALTTGSGFVTDDGIQIKPEVALRIAVGEKVGDSFQPIQVLSTVLELAPLFDSSILTRGNLLMEGDEVFFASKDPRRNEIRAEGESDLPGLTRGDTRFLDFDPALLEDGTDTGNAIFDGKGLLYSGKEVKDSGQTLDGSGLALASERSGGRIVSKGTKRVDIYDLKPENIPQSEPGQLAHDIQVPPGEFRFSQVKAVIEVEEPGTMMVNDIPVPTTVRTTRTEIIDVCAYYDPPGSPTPLKIMRGDVTKVKPGQKIVSAQVPLPDSSGAIPVDIGARFYLNSEFDKTTTSSGVTTPEMGIRSDKNGGDGPVCIDLESQMVQIAPDTRVRPKPRPQGSTLPPSAFELNVVGGLKPTFVLGTEKNDVIFDADGDVKVGSGLTTGLGTVISRRGSVDLQPSVNPFKYEWVKNKDGIYELKRVER